ncbi:PREDICTED: uncharacterized protein LOC104608594 [Nelumbo nucifera]|uniref:Uncharacterized protein LOC104608594 n=1 Tax=Nelumbo nucifera TaxID=4432 RepID=A0A1U8B1A9_NELNU|nr:PREDICTED: uncharacterized protein LOC104608594 [Nelumbo nucifera]
MGLKKGCWWIRTYSTCKAHTFTGITWKYHEGSWTSKHDLRNTYVQCFQASGKIPTDRKEDQDPQSISMGKICDTSKFIRCSHMTFFIFFLFHFCLIFLLKCIKMVRKVK